MITGPASHFVFAAHPATDPPPPEQDVVLSRTDHARSRTPRHWRTLSADTSCKPTGSGAAASAGQPVPLQTGAVDVPETTQAKLCGQSVSALQLWAEARAPAKASRQKVAADNSRVSFVMARRKPA